MKFNISKEWVRRQAALEDGCEVGVGGMMWDRERLKGRRTMRRLTIGVRILYVLLLTLNLVTFGVDIYLHLPIATAVVFIGIGVLFWCWHNVEKSSKEYFDLCAKHDAEFAAMLKSWQPPSGGQ